MTAETKAVRFLNICICTYLWHRSASVDQFLHAILKARCEHVWIDCHKRLALFKHSKPKTI